MKVAFYKDRTHFLDAAISWWTKGSYSHLELVFDQDGKTICASSSPRDGGVRTKEIELDPEHWDIIELKGYDESAAAEWFVNHDGAKYDFAGLFGFVLSPLPEDRSKYFCSEAVAYALGYKDAWRFSPNSLYAVLSRRQ
jgi:hypothetical protein